MTRREVLAAFAAPLAAPLAMAALRHPGTFAPSLALFEQAGARSLTDALDDATARGYSVLDDALLLLRPASERLALVRELRDRSLTIGTFLANSGYADDGLAAGRSEATRRLVEDIQGSLEMADQVGTRVLTVIPGGATGAPADVQTAAEGIREAAELAHRSDRCLGIEALDRARYPGILVGSPEEAAALCTVVDHPGCRVLFDAHQTADPVDSLSRIAASVAYVQVVATPGRPFTRPDRLLQAMRDHGVAAPIGVDGPGLSLEESRRVLESCQPGRTSH